MSNGKSANGEKWVKNTPISPKAVKYAIGLPLVVLTTLNEKVFSMKKVTVFIFLFPGCEKSRFFIYLCIH